MVKSLLVKVRMLSIVFKVNLTSSDQMNFIVIN